MDEDKSGKVLSAKDILFASTTYTNIDLPSGTQIRIHPYVSAKAMDTYVERVSDPRAAFQAMVADSGGEKLSGCEELSEPDAEVIARLYAEKEGFLDSYSEVRKEKGVFEAFAAAFAGTEMWQQREESTKELLAYFKQQEKVFKGIESSAISAGKMLATIPKFDFPTFRALDTAAWIDTRAISVQVSSFAAVSKLGAVERFAEIAALNLKTWTGIAEDLNWASKLGDVFRDHSLHLKILTDRAIAGESLIKSHTNVFASFGRLADELRFPQLSLPSTFELAARAFAESDSLVRSANEFFASRPRWESKLAPLESEPSRAAEADSEIEEAVEETEGLVHVTARQAILVGTDALVVVKGLVGEALEERLQPYAPLLNRMRRLIDPKSFCDTLDSFARDFQRDHWKSLWSEVGKTFKQRPEEIAQALFAMYLQGQYDGVAFVGRELGNGDGFVDVLVNFLGQDFVVEVKIIGASWGIGKAKDGLKQLDEYVQNYKTPCAYLLVFDGRQSARGEQLDAEYTMASGTRINVVVVRSYFEAPSKKPH